MPSLRTEVLVIGAGPAGSAAARVLTSRGVETLLVDRWTFPRDKVCGDALIPDSLHALHLLGLRQPVIDLSLQLKGIRVYAPSGRSVTLEGGCACVQRGRFDDLLRSAAVESGAHFLSPWKVLRPLDEQGGVRGAVVRNMISGDELHIRAQVTLLATGSAGSTLDRFKVAISPRPSAMAARAYFKVDPQLAASFEHLWISYDRCIAPGYGWIFPGPQQIFNVGVGYFCDAKRRPTTHNIRSLWNTFLESFPPARDIVARSEQLTALKGAPLRTGLSGSRLSRPGLLVLGEAAGLTYSATGEGIGKAMESGIIAADIIASAAASSARLDPAELGRLYATRVQAEFGDRFRSYKAAQDWLAYPRLADFLAWRAGRSPYVHAQLAGLFSETVDPRAVFSVRGILRGLLA